MVDVQPSNHLMGASSGFVGYDIINIEDLKNNLYEITFFKDSAATLYSAYWRLTNVSENTLLIDSSLSYTYGESNVAGKMAEGFIPKVENITTTLG